MEVLTTDCCLPGERNVSDVTKLIELSSLLLRSKGVSGLLAAFDLAQA